MAFEPVDTDAKYEKWKQDQQDRRDRQATIKSDRYNTVQEQQDLQQYKRIINAKIAISPKSAETLKQYIEKIKIHQAIALEKNWRTHVDNGKKTWYTHSKNILNCFMCEDTQFIGVLVQVLEYISETNPEYTF